MNKVETLANKVNNILESRGIDCKIIELSAEHIKILYDDERIGYIVINVPYLEACVIRINIYDYTKSISRYRSGKSWVEIRQKIGYNQILRYSEDTDMIEVYYTEFRVKMPTNYEDTINLIQTLDITLTI